MNYRLEEYLCEDRSGAPSARATQSRDDSLTAHAEFGNASNLHNLFVLTESASTVQVSNNLINYFVLQIIRKSTHFHQIVFLTPADNTMRESPNPFQYEVVKCASGLPTGRA